jgi:hypothetical protein
MPDTQIHPLGVEPAPADYPIPDTAELLLKSVRATFDGSGAAGPFVPLLRIISDAGSITDEIPQDVTVAAGASADATWFPHVAAVAQSAPSGTALPWAYISGGGSSHNCPGSSTTRIPASAATFYTTSSATFDAHNSSGGVMGLRILADGHYLVFMTARLTSVAVAGDLYQLIIEGGGEFPDFNFAPFNHVFPAGGVVDTGDMETGGVMCVGGFIAPPTDAIVCRIDNSSTHTLHVEYGGTVIMQLDTVNQDLN